MSRILYSKAIGHTEHGHRQVSDVLNIIESPKDVRPNPRINFWFFYYDKAFT